MYLLKMQIFTFPLLIYKYSETKHFYRKWKSIESMFNEEVFLFMLELMKGRQGHSFLTDKIADTITVPARFQHLTQETVTK